MCQATSADLELKKAFLEYQVKMLATGKEIQEIEDDIINQRQLLQQVHSGMVAIINLPEDQLVYEPVGRVFIRSDVKTMKNNYHIREMEINRHIQEQTYNKVFLQHSLKDSRKNIREMIKLRKQQYRAKKRRPKFY